MRRLEKLGLVGLGLVAGISLSLAFCSVCRQGNDRDPFTS